MIYTQETVLNEVKEKIEDEKNSLKEGRRAKAYVIAPGTLFRIFGSDHRLNYLQKKAELQPYTVKNFHTSHQMLILLATGIRCLQGTKTKFAASCTSYRNKTI